MGRRPPGLRGHEVDGEFLEDPHAPRATAPPVDDHLARRAERERRDLIGLAHAALAQLAEQQDEHLLHEVGGRGVAAQMFEPVEPDARAEPAAQLRLRGGIADGRAIDDPLRECSVVVRV
jgi:hypothetical protein